MRSNNNGDLYPFSPSPSPSLPTVSLTTSSSTLWHNRLGHPGHHVLDFLWLHSNINCNKEPCSHLCNSCQISKHKRLPFNDSSSVSLAPFDIVHSDLWTSPVPSKSGYKYYLILIDNFSHYVWVYPLKYKSEVFPKFLQFRAYVHTQFNNPIKSFQCDMGRKFDNSSYHTLATHHGLSLRFSCPQTSSQNGKAERMIRRINEIVMALLYHASLPPEFWVEVLHTATYLHNILPTKTLAYRTPVSVLFLKHPTYDHIRVFGCLCYPNLSAKRHHKLDPRSTRCVFLGYPANYRGYRCLDLNTGKVILSRHVTFDENVFPYASPNTLPRNKYSFFDLGFTPLNPFLYDQFTPPATLPSNPTPPEPVTPTATPTPPPVPTSQSATCFPRYNTTPLQVYTRRSK